MTGHYDRRQVLRLGAGFGAMTLLAACDTTSFNFGGPTGAASGSSAAAPPQSFGTGKVRVALLLPLSGDPALANVGISMANAAQLAINYVSSSPRIGDNITLMLMDTGATAQGAAQQAKAAVAAGASLILGPLKADQVQAAGAIARQSNIPLIGFSNNSSAAAPGVYLLNVLPEAEIHRSLGYAQGRGKKAVAAIVSTAGFGMVQQQAFQQAAGAMGITPRGIATFGNDNAARAAVAQLAPQLLSGGIDALFMPDRASAPMLAAALQQAGVPQGRVMLIGSADWDGDASISASPYLVGAVYPTVDDTGYAALKPEYEAKFGSAPHPLATIAYTATVLANAAPLALVSPAYPAAQLTLPGGFNGRDGVFRFLPNGQSQYALIMKQVTAGGAVRIDGPKL